MKRAILLSLALLLIVAGAAFASGLEMKQRAGEYNVAVSLDKNPPVVGSNNMEITIADASGRYVNDAKVIVNYSMPAMPGMPAANYKTVAIPSGSKYTAQINPSMSGSWNVAVKVIRGGRTSTGKFNIDAQ